MNKHIIVLLILHLFISFNLSYAWNKCCDVNDNLHKTRVKDQWIYQCVNNTNDENILSLKFKSYNGYGIPQNCSNDLICIDKLVDPGKSNGDIIALSCETKRILYVSKLPTINKCCPNGLFYDKKFKKCIEQPFSVIEKLTDTVADVYNINYGFPNCIRRVFMEKEYTGINLKIKNGTLELISDFNTVIETFQNGTYCVDIRDDNDIFRATVVYCIPPENDIKEFCTENTCVPKCCPFGHIYRKGKIKLFECFPDWQDPFDPSFENESPDEFNIMSQPTCRIGKYLKTPFKLLNNGTLRTSSTIFYDSFMNKYCLDKFNTSSQNGYVAVICFSKKITNFWQTFFVLVGLLISIFFLGVTLTIYFFLPELQNLHGRTVMSHTTSLLAAYICLAFVKQQETNYAPNICMILGYGIMFTFLSAFTWLNVMCFDIWWTFGIVKARGLTKNKDLKKFLYYCIYAHGLPLIVTATAITVDLHPHVPKIYKPKIADYACWFNLVNGAPIEYTIFFISPVAVLIICNIILFILTARHCLKIRQDIQRMQHNDSPKKRRFLADKATFMMNIKLFVVMGITWIFELISAYVREPEQLWVFFDTINVLQGLWIFFIFVFKENVWKAIKKKLGYKTIREGSTQTTLSTKMSSASNASMKLNGLKQEEKDLLQNVANKTKERSNN